MKGQEAPLLNEIILGFSNGSAFGWKDSEELKTERQYYCLAYVDVTRRMLFYNIRNSQIKHLFVVVRT